ncbi:MAG: potassium channel family protein [Patescibacteria group bacterium]|nr:potassium channel family protein [Patescibacteria group bacterium]
MPFDENEHHPLLSRIIELINDGEQKNIDRVERALHAELNHISEKDFEERGLRYYYLVRNLLNKKTEHESKRMVQNFDKMVICFDQRRNELLNQFKHKPAALRPVYKMTIEAYMQVIGNYFHHLENEFRHRNLIDLASICYRQRMHYRRKLFLLRKKYAHWLGYNIWSLTSHYGDNFLRWGITSLCFIVLLSLLIGISGHIQKVPIDKDGHMIITSTLNPQDIAGYANHPMLYKHYSAPGHWYDYPYVTLVTFTTLGYGDFVPVTWLDKILVTITVLSGYLMLGILVALLGKKI